MAAKWLRAAKASLLEVVKIKYRTLDKQGDYTFGRQDFRTGRQAVAQAVLTRMRLLLGEWWENTGDGLPLFQKILGTSGSDENKNAVDLIVSRRVLETEGVLNIEKFNSAFENRRYWAVLSVNTVYGGLELTFNDTGGYLEVDY